jgi:ABC-type transport system involved in multi-copper enzyme maturation permease subunit
VNPFGPILRLELVGIARRQRLTAARCLYAVALAAVAATTYASATKGWSVRTRPQDLAAVTEGLFYGLFAIQFALAVPLTLNATAGAVAAEREKQTLPFLLATPLGDAEIVLSKLAARLAQVALLLLAGLPVLCALLFFGGVEPEVVWLGYAALAATVLSLGGLSLLSSVYGRTTREAGQRAGRVAVLYVILLVPAGQALRAWPAVATFPGGYVTVQDVYDWLAAGDPLAVGQELAYAVRGGWRLADAVVPAVRNYVVFHLLAAGTFLTVAAVRLRPAAADLADGPPPPKRTGLFRPPPRPPVGDRPVLWKTLHFDFRQFRTAAGRALGQVVFLLSFTPLAVALGITAATGTWGTLPRVTNVLVRGLGTAALAGACLIIAAHASGCIARERRRRTLEELLLTDLSTSEILAQKWWASVAVVRWALVWVVIHWAVAVVCGGLHPLAVPALAVEWVAYAAFAASLGVYWAARMPTARAAGVGTGLIGFAAAAGPIVAGTAIGIATDGQGGWFALPGGLSPLAALGVSAFTRPELAGMLPGHRRELVMIVAGITAGVVLYAALAWRLWRGACRWFPRTVGRGSG